ncbi:MAG TPA: efflux RND transporter periplasmic adaptor subunit [Candidatus Binataceae bacterium]
MTIFSSKWVRAAIAVAVVLVAAGYYLRHGAKYAKYVTAQVTRGNIVRSVTATGTVNPVVTVQVGSYVSGTIIQLYVDFNSPVKAGQLMAKIDPRPFAAQVALTTAELANAQAQLNKDRANLAYQKLTYERDGELLKEKAVSQDQLDSQLSLFHQAEAQVALDEAAVQQQQASLQAARLNLNYTNIVSPVDGTVVSRNVDQGQTVAASYQTPTLFLVAKDLTKMQVDSNVSESDIGYVQQGQRATFKVDAFPDRDFEGTIGQVRQAPITVQNVVTYDVVVNVANPEQLLKPGMTANVTLVTARRENVIRIPIDAIRFSPKKTEAATVESAGPLLPSRSARVWIQGGRRGIKPVPVTIGLDDGTFVEMIKGPLHVGDLVITDEIRPIEPKPTAAGMGGIPRGFR